MNYQELKEKEYEKCVGLLADLIDLDADTRQKIHKYIHEMGIKNFFLQIESMDFSQETSEKLKSIKAIIELSDIKRGKA